MNRPTPEPPHGTAAPSLAFVNGTAVLSDRLLHRAVLVTEGPAIRYIGDAPCELPPDCQRIDLADGFVAPGWVDLHIHGGGGADVMDGTAEALRTVCRAHAVHGTTTLFPTTTTAPAEQLGQLLEQTGQHRTGASIDDGARIEGIHLYGPYFAPEKAGCHEATHCRPPDPREYSRYLESGLVRIATCAAELPGAGDFYRAARRAHCLVTCGHSNASWEEMQHAFAAGTRHVDHFWCAMSSVASLRERLGVPMRGSMLEFVLAESEMSTEVIADGMHLAPELLRFAWQMKGPQRLCLVTDCSRALDMPPGRYRFGNQRDGSWLESDGRVGWAGPGSLASSVRGMDHMVRTMHAAEIPLVDCVRMATLTPAERTGIDSEVGSLEVGKRADLLWLDSALQVRGVWIGGERFS
jgi:N-acetylglucosamine-6-phosphate deacetylase